MATRQAQRQQVRTVETHAAAAVALPDDHLLLTLDDGRSLVIDGERLSPQEDGAYQVEVVAADLDSHAPSAPRTAAIRQPLVGARFRVALQERLQDDVGKSADLHDAASGERDVERRI